MSQVAEGITPHIIHGEVIADVIVGIAIVELVDVERILRVNHVRVQSSDVQSKRGQ